ncbi:MAG: aspartate/glutamate racemase family protein [Acetobacteraceae bacterium]
MPPASPSRCSTSPSPRVCASARRGCAESACSAPPSPWSKDFYRRPLERRFGLEVLVPEAADRRVVHDIIYQELVAGRVEPASREAYRGVIARLVARGAEAVILGCTEIMLLIGAADSTVPLFDTTRLHAEARWRGR